MTSDEEDKYFETKQAEWREDVRREKRLRAIQDEEREGVAEALNTTEEVAQEALELGFDQQTARVLPLVPLIQMAWADGNVSGSERRTIQKLATEFGLDPDAEAFEFLQLMLQEQPSDLFFTRVNRVVGHLLEKSPGEWETTSLVDLSKEVAAASGGFFGLTNPITSDEQELLDKFAEQFAVSGKKAGELVDEE